MSKLHYDNLRAPWTAQPDPDGPTTILNNTGYTIGEVDPRFAGAVTQVPRMLSALAQLIDVPGDECSCDMLVIGKCLPCEVRDIFRKAGLL